jgi:two-component system NtrC family sensor kinase
MGKDGSITLTTFHQPDTQQVVIKISDAGPGIPKDVLAKIFDPFFTTKEVGKGTGLGLSISYSIIEKLGGTITVDSEVGQGTTFTISLPVK